MNKKNKEKSRLFKESIKEFFVSPKPRPKRDWIFMLSFFFIFLLFLTVVNASLFFYWGGSYDNEELVSTDVSFEDDVMFKDTKVDLDREKVDNVWSFFRDKETDFNKIEKNWLIKSPLLNEALLTEDEEGGENNQNNGESENKEPEEDISVEVLF